MKSKNASIILSESSRAMVNLIQPSMGCPTTRRSQNRRYNCTSSLNCALSLIVVVALVPFFIHSLQTRQVSTMSSTICRPLGGAPPAESMRCMAFSLA
eukprot:4996505-Pyramimonas_sp.AAC.1